MFSKMQFTCVPISAFSSFLSVGQTEWHESFRAQSNHYPRSSFHPQKAPCNIKGTSVGYYCKTYWPKGDFCNLLSEHFRLLGYQKLVKIWATVPHFCFDKSPTVNTTELRGLFSMSSIKKLPPCAINCLWKGVVHTFVGNWHLSNSK